MKAHVSSEHSLNKSERFYHFLTCVDLHTYIHTVECEAVLRGFFTEATTAYIKRCIKDATVELWPEAGHLDFGWARSRSVDLYPRLVRLILST